MKLVNKAAANAMVTPATPATKIKLEGGTNMNSFKEAADLLASVSVNQTCNNQMVGTIGEKEVTEELLNAAMLKNCREVGQVLGTEAIRMFDVFQGTSARKDGVEVTEKAGVYYPVSKVFRYFSEREEVIQENWEELTAKIKELAKIEAVDGRYVIEKYLDTSVKQKEETDAVMKKVDGKDVEISTIYEEGSSTKTLSIRIPGNNDESEYVTVKTAQIDKVITGTQAVKLIQKHYDTFLSGRKNEEKGKITKSMAQFKEILEKINFVLVNGSLYSANVLVSKLDGAPKNLAEDTELLNTTAFGDLLLEKAIEMAVRTKANIDIFEIYFAKQINVETKNAAKTLLYNGAVFQNIGTIEELSHSFLNMLKGFFGMYIISKRWASILTATQRLNAEFIYKNEVTASFGGSGYTSVEFKTLFPNEKLKKMVYRAENSLKINRHLNSGKGSETGLRSINGNDIPAICYFKTTQSGMSNMLNGAITSMESLRTLAPNNLREALKKALKFSGKMHTAALKRITTSMKINLIADTEEVRAIANFYGCSIEEVPFLIMEGEAKAEVAFWNFFQRKIMVWMETEGLDWAVLDSELEEFKKAIEEKTLPEFKKTMVKIVTEKVEDDGTVKEIVQTEELYYAILPTSFHYGKDAWTASGKNAFSTQGSTMQSLLNTLLALEDEGFHGEDAFREMASRKLINKKELLKVLASAGLDMVKGNFVKVSDDAKFTFSYEEAAASSKMVRILKGMKNAEFTKSTKGQVHFNTVSGTTKQEAIYNRENGFYYDGAMLKQFVESEEGTEVFFRTKQTSMLNAAEVEVLFDSWEVMDYETVLYFKQFFIALADSKIIDFDCPVFRYLENIRVMELEEGKFMPFTCSSKKIQGEMPKELRSMFRVLRVVYDNYDLDSVLDYSVEKVVENFKSLNNYELEEALAYGEIKETPFFKANAVTHFEANGRSYRLNETEVSKMNSAKASVNRPMLELREALLNKAAKDYLTIQYNRAWFTVITHSENPLMAFVNKKMFKKMLSKGIIREVIMADGSKKFFVALRRYPETIFSELVVEIKIKNGLTDNTISVSDVLLAFFMGDTDGDMFECFAPASIAMDTRHHEAIKTYAAKIRRMYNKMYQVKDSNDEAYSKFGKVFKEFGLDAHAAVKSLREGVLLNEGTSSKTGQIIAWDTKIVTLLFEAGAEIELIRVFKQVVGAYIAQITIAAKNNTGDALKDFHEAIDAFLGMNIYSSKWEKAAKIVLTSVKCKFGVTELLKK